MERHASTAGPIVAFCLLLLFLYVGSYLALVTPTGTFVADPASPYGFELPGGTIGRGRMDRYRVGNRSCQYIFFPLEQIDRRLRPSSWPALAFEPDQA